MRFLHTSDWHLGRLFFGESLTEEQAALLSEFTVLAKDLKPDAVLIAGDVYDRSVPPADAVELLDEVLAKLVLEMKIPVLIIAGNHDSAPRLAFGSRFFGKSGLHVCSSVRPEQITLTDQWGPVRFVLVPYADTAAVRLDLRDEAITDADGAMNRRMREARAVMESPERKVVVAHAFLAGGQSSESERPLSVGGAGAVAADHLDSFHYAALGHLHRPQQLGGGRIVYSGSLMKYSFDEAGQTKGLFSVELDQAGNVKKEFVALPGRRDVRVVEGLFQELMQGPCDGENPLDYLSVILLDEAPVIQAIHRLRTLYPKTMEINYRYQQQGLQTAAGSRPDHRSHTGLELFESFAEWSMQKPLSEKQREVMASFLVGAAAEAEGGR